MKDLEDPKIESKINSFVEKETSFTMTKIRRGFRAIPKAWQALPEPKLEWELANWISACMYSAYFDLADYVEAKKWRDDFTETWIGYRHCTVNRLGYGLLRVESIR